MTERRDEIVDVLRGRILRGLHAGVLRQGDRVQSARELESELDIDHRAILDAYRVLAAEGLVEMRPRGGIYVAARTAPGGTLSVPEMWIADVLAQGIAREIPIPELHEWMRRLVETLRLRAVAVAGTEDQTLGLCRELRDDYGLESSGVSCAAVRAAAGDPAGGSSSAVPHELRTADIIVATEACATECRALAARLGVPCIVITVRPDLIGGEWRLLLRQPVWVIVADEGFVGAVRKFFAEAPGAENIRILVAGRDDPATIPDGAPTYVTRAAREKLGDARIPGRILPATRMFSAECSRELIAFIVRSNLDALTRRGG